MASIVGPALSGTVLITGGAGFIGSHVARRLLALGFPVRVIDNLDPQVHPGGARPAHLSDDVELLVGDVRDEQAVRRALRGVDRVIHLAARVGVGQSMYEIAGYSSVNAHGTGVLLEAMVGHDIGHLVVASSMSVYGEGLYRTSDGRLATAVARDRRLLERGEWEARDPGGDVLEPLPTPETKPPSLTSIYALGKFGQERMCLLFGSSYDVPTTALRLFNVYGPGQALSNPYTGVLAIFGARLLHGKAPLVFEDGGQRRDFVSVHDAARACVLALDRGAGEVVNVACGQSVTIAELATRLAAVLGRENVVPDLTHRYRVGDVRHCFADISLARDVLGYTPEVVLADGLLELAEWLAGQNADDRSEAHQADLAARGLAL